MATKYYRPKRRPCPFCGRPYNPARRRDRCYECRRAPATRRGSYDTGEKTPPESVDPGRAARVALYAARASRNEPLFG